MEANDTFRSPRSLVDLVASVTGDWTVGELAAYMDRHTSDNGEWDGAIWPHGIYDSETHMYVCQVCRFSYEAADTPHDCEDSVWRDPNWAGVSVQRFVLGNRRGS